MAAKWQINGTDIYVSKEEITRELKRAELFILDGTSSVWHFFGSGSRKYSIEGLVIGETNRNAIETTATGNILFTMVCPFGNVTSCKIDKNPKFTAKLYAGATIDGTTYSVGTTALYDAQIDIIVTA